MKQLLGFAVLTSPLFLIVIWVPVCIGLGIWVGRKFIKKGAPVKVAGGVLVFLIALILPISDEIAGRIYFNHLCKTEAGVKVYQTIALPARYWDKDGEPKFYVNRYDKDKLRFIFSKGEMVTSPKFKYTWLDAHEHIPFHVEKDVLKISIQPSGVVLGEYTILRYWGGWMRRNLSAHNSAMGCSLKELNGWELKVFTSQPRQQ